MDAYGERPASVVRAGHDGTKRIGDHTAGQATQGCTEGTTWAGCKLPTYSMGGMLGRGLSSTVLQSACGAASIAGILRSGGRTAPVYRRRRVFAERRKTFVPCAACAVGTHGQLGVRALHSGVREKWEYVRLLREGVSVVLG